MGPPPAEKVSFGAPGTGLIAEFEGRGPFVDLGVKALFFPTSSGPQPLRLDDGLGRLIVRVTGPTCTRDGGFAPHQALLLEYARGEPHAPAFYTQAVSTMGGYELWSRWTDFFPGQAGSQSYWWFGIPDHPSLLGGSLFAGVSEIFLGGSFEGNVLSGRFLDGRYNGSPAHWLEVPDRVRFDVGSDRGPSDEIRFTLDVGWTDKFEAWRLQKFEIWIDPLHGLPTALQARIGDEDHEIRLVSVTPGEPGASYHKGAAPRTVANAWFAPHAWQRQVPPDGTESAVWFPLSEAIRQAEEQSPSFARFRAENPSSFVASATFRNESDNMTLREAWESNWESMSGDGWRMAIRKSLLLGRVERFELESSEPLPPRGSGAPAPSPFSSVSSVSAAREVAQRIAPGAALASLRYDATPTWYLLRLADSAVNTQAQPSASVVPQISLHHDGTLREMNLPPSWLDPSLGWSGFSDGGPLVTMASVAARQGASAQTC